LCGRSGLHPTFDATATWTDNYNLSSTQKQSDLVLQVSPGLRYNSSAGRVQGFLDYALTGVAHTLRRNRKASDSVLIKRDCGVMRRYFSGISEDPIHS